MRLFVVYIFMASCFLECKDGVWGIFGSVVSKAVNLGEMDVYYAVYFCRGEGSSSQPRRESAGLGTANDPRSGVACA